MKAMVLNPELETIQSAANYVQECTETLAPDSKAQN